MVRLAIPVARERLVIFCVVRREPELRVRPVVVLPHVEVHAEEEDPSVAQQSDHVQEDRHARGAAHLRTASLGLAPPLAEGAARAPAGVNIAELYIGHRVYSLQMVQL